MQKRRREVEAENPDLRFAILYALSRGRRRFEELWRELRISGEIRSKITLSRYLKALEKERVIMRKRISHKHVTYEIPLSERSSWILAVHEVDTFPSGVEKAVINVILNTIGDKAKALDIALNYAFQRFFEEEATYASAKIMGAMPKYRPFLAPEASKVKDTEDWSEEIIAWHSRRYYMFLKNLRRFLDEHPKHLERYLTIKPWLKSDREPSRTTVSEFKRECGIIRRILAEKYPEILARVDLRKLSVEASVEHMRLQQ